MEGVAAALPVIGFFFPELANFFHRELLDLRQSGFEGCGVCIGEAVLRDQMRLQTPVATRVVAKKTRFTLRYRKECFQTRGVQHEKAALVCALADSHLRVLDHKEEAVVAERRADERMLAKKPQPFGHVNFMEHVAHHHHIHTLGVEFCAQVSLLVKEAVVCIAIDPHNSILAFGVIAPVRVKGTIVDPFRQCCSVLDAFA